MNSYLYPTFSRVVATATASLLALVVLPRTAHATPVTVQEVGTGAGEDVTINDSALGTLEVFAGAIDLKVNGASMTGFCIDPWHESVTGPQSYVSEALTSAPKAPGPMTALQATTIETLWSQNYSATMTNQEAAGLQIAIWETESGMGGDTFSLSSSDDFGAASMITDAEQGGTKASLIALSGPGQDYAVGGQAVPDAPATALLFVLGIAGLTLGTRAVRFRI